MTTYTRAIPADLVGTDYYGHLHVEAGDGKVCVAFDYTRNGDCYHRDDIVLDREGAIALAADLLANLDAGVRVVVGLPPHACLDTEREN